MSVQDAVRQTRLSSFRTWPVAEGEHFLGMLTGKALKSALAAGKKEEPLRSLVEKTVDLPHLHSDQPMHMALERMSRQHLDVLPVVHRADVHKLLGVVTLRDVLDSYGVNNSD
jgi:CBS domain-containing protein